MNRKGAYLHRLFIITILLVFCCTSSSSGQAKETKIKALNFAGAIYLHRWSKDGQNEFTPQSQTDLSTWKDMVTIILHDKVKNENQLAELANSVLRRYQQYQFGDVLRTDSKPRTAGSPAEHLIVVLLADPTLMEAVFARIILRDGAGVIAMYAHRFYGNGQETGSAMGEWLEANAPQVEKALMTWDAVPRAAALKQLPQSN